MLRRATTYVRPVVLLHRRRVTTTRQDVVILLQTRKDLETQLERVNKDIKTDTLRCCVTIGAAGFMACAPDSITAKILNGLAASNVFLAADGVVQLSEKRKDRERIKDALAKTVAAIHQVNQA